MHDVTALATQQAGPDGLAIQVCENLSNMSFPMRFAVNVISCRFVCTLVVMIAFLNLPVGAAAWFTFQQDKMKSICAVADKALATFVVIMCVRSNMNQRMDECWACVWQFSACPQFTV
eukprot:3730885-Pyramimonas_sp.AAC.1